MISDFLQMLWLVIQYMGGAILGGFVAFVLGAVLAERMGLPYVGYVTRVEAQNGKVVARKEYPGGLNADIEVSKPAVLGIQAADKPGPATS